MGVNLLSQSESTLGHNTLSVERPGEAKLRSSASDQWLWHPLLWHGGVLGESLF